MLDLLPFGVIVFTPLWRIRYSNQIADNMLAKADGVRRSGTLLHLCDPQTRSEIGRWLRSKSVDPGNREEINTRVFTIHRQLGGKPLTARVSAPCLPFRSTQSLVKAWPGNALLLLSDPDSTQPPRCHDVGVLFGLSRRESELAIHLWKGGTLKNAEPNLGMSVNTAKTHLARIFEKTGVSRQQELLRLLHRSFPPYLAEIRHKPPATPKEAPEAVA